MTADHLTVGSLCTGYGGLDLACRDVMETRTAWVSEIDAQAAKVCRLRYRAPNLGDVKHIQWGEVERPDVITAGYPCQPFSSAGRRRGADDPRHIWPHIAEGVRALRPRLVVLENVAGHLTKGFGEVLGTLAEMGYDATWGCVRASDAGAPHRRTRLFVVAVPDTTRSDGRLAQLASVAPATAPPPEPRERGGPSPWGKWEGAIRCWEQVMGRPAPRPVRHGMVSGAWIEWMMGLKEGWVTGAVDDPLAQLKILGNGVVPQQAALALTHLLPLALAPSRQRTPA
jgi:DNA (cytosine-5)-methyltransferase 1